MTTAAWPSADVGLECVGLRRTFATADGPTVAVDDLSLTLGESEFVCLVGPSGCGKTTLLKMLAGLITPSAGHIRFLAPEKERRARTALVFQEPGLFPWMKVRDNVAFGLEARGVPRRERLARAQAFLAQVGLGHVARRHPHELSLGMRQRVNLGRALLTDPQLLLMDEPFGSLDALTRQALQEELLRRFAERRRMVLFVTHDIEEALLLGDRVLVMSGGPGRIREQITVPLPRPRTLTGEAGARIAKLKAHVWDILEDEVRRGLGLEP
jgi:NitT/TauT family transport system ATP-binding protein